jgi:hypothetical protein
MKIIVVLFFFIGIYSTAFAQEVDTLKVITVFKVTKFKIANKKNFSKSELDSLDISLLIYINQYDKNFFGKYQKTGNLLLCGKVKSLEQIENVDEKTGYPVDNLIFTWNYYDEQANFIEEKANVVLSITYINPLLKTFVAKMYLQKKDEHWYFEGYMEF